MKIIKMSERDVSDGKWIKWNICCLLRSLAAVSKSFVPLASFTGKSFVDNFEFVGSIALLHRTTNPARCVTYKSEDD